MEEDNVRVVAIGVLTWAAVFVVFRKIFSKYSYDFCNRLVSTVHATVAVTLASFSVQDWSCPLSSSLSNKSSPKQMQTLVISLSYMIYDLICCNLKKQISVDNTVHHLVSIVGIVAGLSYQRCVSEMVAALWITEISSPFLHLREILKEMGYRDTNLNLVADITFATIFSVARMVAGPCLTYVVLSADYPIIIKAMGLGLQLVSAFWFYKILKMMRYKLKKKSTSHSKSY